MFSKKTMMIAVLILVVAFNIILLSVSTKRDSSSYGIGKISISFIAAFQEVATHAIRFVKGVWEEYFYLVSVAKVNSDLRRQLNLTLENENQCIEALHSNIRLRSLMEFKETQTVRFLAAEVLGRDPSPWFKTITIDKGAAEGVKKKMPVVVPEGIVGLITDVANHYSKVLLIIDHNSSVDALVQTSRVRGTVTGSPAGDCILKYILRRHEVQPKDILISSGLDGIFPKGLRIGYISDIYKQHSGIFQDVRVIPFVDFETLEEVLIVKYQMPSINSQWLLGGE